jgi:nucleoside-diphosphate-sugar epimerase
MRCLVTGASGAVGPSLVARLLRENWTVRVLSRKPDQHRWNGAVELRAGDLHDETAVLDAMRERDVVFHLAALLHETDPASARREEYVRVNEDGTKRVVNAALTSGVSRVILFSTIAVYGPTHGETVDEDRQPQPDTPYGETKLSAERIVLEARAGDGTPIGTALRLAAVYGPRMKGNYRRLVEALARNRFLPIGASRNRRTLVFDDDVADAALAAAISRDAAGRVYNVIGGIHTMDEILGAICRALGRTTPRVYVPVAPVRLGAMAIESAAAIVGVRPLIRVATVDKYLEDVAVSGTRITHELGWRATRDLQTGWQECIRQMRRCGDLM